MLPDKEHLMLFSSPPDLAQLSSGMEPPSPEKEPPSPPSLPLKQPFVYPRGDQPLKFPQGQ